MTALPTHAPAAERDTFIAEVHTIADILGESYLGALIAEAALRAALKHWPAHTREGWDRQTLLSDLDNAIATLIRSSIALHNAVPVDSSFPCHSDTIDAALSTTKHPTGYRYHDDNYCAPCLIETMIRTGEAAPAARDMDTEDALDQIASANAIDRNHPSSFSPGIFPHVLLAEYRPSDAHCATCRRKFAATVRATSPGPHPKRRL